jgi:hypothetical protein
VMPELYIFAKQEFYVFFTGNSVMMSVIHFSSIQLVLI